MTERIAGRTMRSALLAALLAGAFLVSIAVSSAEAAHTQAVPETFHAPRCPGTTVFDPTDAEGPVPDLTLVFGQRLVDYQAGRTVVLYDSFGGQDLEDDSSYPPLCGTRFVDGFGAVSEWMFCTDRSSAVCGGTDENGDLTEVGEPVGSLAGLTGNQRLSTEQEKLISHLIQNGHSYDGVGGQSWGGVTRAEADVSTNSRAALQTLVWCISDPPETTSSADFRATCEQSMSSATQARLLASIPDEPHLEMHLDGGGVVEIGTTVRLTLQTNLHHQPIALEVVGDAEVRSCDDRVEVVGSTVTIEGGDPPVVSEVELCVDSQTEGAVDVILHGTPPSLEHISWNQSPGTADIRCQVFATFNADEQVELLAATQIRFIAQATTTTEEPTTTTAPDETTTSSAVDSDDSTTTSAAPDRPETTGGSNGTPGVGHPGRLARTGSAPAPLVLLGLIMVIAGATALRRSARIRRA